MSRTFNAVMPCEAIAAEGTKGARDHLIWINRGDLPSLNVLFGALRSTVAIPALAQIAYLQRVARHGQVSLLVSTFEPRRLFSIHQIGVEGEGMNHARPPWKQFVKR